MDNYIKNSFMDRIEIYKKLVCDETFLNSINEAYKNVKSALQNNSKLMICGNGGSASDSQHIAAEFVVKLTKQRIPLAAISLTSDNSVLTAIANDFTYDLIFERQVKAVGQEGDVLIGLTTSGNSSNIVKAFKAAKTLGIKTIIFTGKDFSPAAKESDIHIAFNIDNTQIIQELYMACLHSICEKIEGLYEESSIY